MKRVFYICLAAAYACGQGHNYTQGDIEEGTRQYRTNCIGCHGPEGSSVTGIDLGRAKFRRVTSDEDIVNVMINGIPGTGMPPHGLSNARAYAIVAYLRSMNATTQKSIAAASGDGARGRALFAAQCATCHRVRGEGGRSGPDLSEAGLSMRAIEIETSMLEPDAAFSTSSRPFRVVMKDGSAVTGLLANQDMLSVQMTTDRGALVSLAKSELREWGFEKKSPMPSYRGRMSPQELADVIAYVGSLRGAQ